MSNQKKVFAVGVNRVQTGVVYVIADDIDEAIKYAKENADQIWWNENVFQDYETKYGQLYINVESNAYSVDNDSAESAINWEDEKEEFEDED